jgi:hypothetical protein
MEEWINTRSLTLISILKNPDINQATSSILRFAHGIQYSQVTAKYPTPPMMNTLATLCVAAIITDTTALGILVSFLFSFFFSLCTFNYCFPLCLFLLLCKHRLFYTFSLSLLVDSS